MNPGDMVAQYEWLFNSPLRSNQQKDRQIRRQAFSAYLFHIIGNRNLLLACI